MATSVELARAIASAFGLPDKTVLLYLKHIRAKGVITFKGYGRGAAEMTAADAAALIIAVAGGIYAPNAATTYSDFAHLRMLSKPRSRTLHMQLAYLIDDLREGAEGRLNRPASTGNWAHPNVLPEASLKLAWVDGAVGTVPPRIAVVRYFTSGGKPTQRTFASESLSRTYYDEARLMAEFSGVRLVTARSVSLAGLEQVVASL
jgi:hypothetical protein